MEIRQYDFTKTMDYTYAPAGEVGSRPDANVVVVAFDWEVSAQKHHRALFLRMHTHGNHSDQLFDRIPSRLEQCKVHTRWRA